MEISVKKCILKTLGISIIDQTAVFVYSNGKFPLLSFVVLSEFWRSNLNQATTALSTAFNIHKKNHLTVLCYITMRFRVFK